MAPTNKTKTAKEEDNRQGNPSQQSKSAVTSVLNTAAHGATRAVTSRASSATSSTPATRSDNPPDPPKTIVAALNEKLPDFPSGQNSNFADTVWHSITKPTGKSTTNAVPPTAWIAEDMESFLKTHFTNELAKISVPGMAPQLEKSFRMSNEADVVRASAVYLLNVVNIAAQAWLGDEYVLKCNAEAHSGDEITDNTNTDNTNTENINTDNTNTDSTKTETIQIRTDIEWTLESPADAKEPPRKVAVMEYKRKHLINPKQLLDARYYYQSEEPQKFKLDAKRFRGESTYFADTAFWLIKQVKGYQKQRKVRDICLFDWDTMFILDFEDGFNPDAQGSSEEDKDKGKKPQGVPTPKNDTDIDKLWPAGILYQELAESSERVATFRNLLLAFLIRALKRVKKEPSVPITYDKPPQPPSHGEAGGVNPARSETPAETTGEQKSLPIRPQQGGNGTGGQGVGPRRGERATGGVATTRGTGGVTTTRERGTTGRGTTTKGKGTTGGGSKEVK